MTQPHPPAPTSSSTASSSTHPSTTVATDEIEVMPGVFFTPAPSKKTQQDATKPLPTNTEDLSQFLQLSNNVTENIQYLIFEHTKLNTSLKHLYSSQKQLKAYDPEGTDADISNAVMENCIVISKYKRLCTQIQDLLREYGGPILKYAVDEGEDEDMGNEGATQTRAQQQQQQPANTDIEMADGGVYL